jgi:ribosome-associated protein
VKATAKTTTSLQLAKLCRELALDKKAEDVVILDLRGISPVADFFVVCTGNSEPHLKAIADNISMSMREKGLRPHGRDGYAPSRWIVMDFSDVMVHIFHPDLREHYDLERLWGDAKRVK